MSVEGKSLSKIQKEQQYKQRPVVKSELASKTESVIKL